MKSKVYFGLYFFFMVIISPLIFADETVTTTTTTTHKILYVGDSHSVGTFGKTLETELKSKGHTVVRKAVGGTGIRAWMSGRHGSNIIFDPLDILIQKNSPTMVIIALGTNVFNFGISTNTKDAQNLISKIPANVKCVWIGPPEVRENPSVYAGGSARILFNNGHITNVYSALNSVIGSRCKLIDSRPFAIRTKTSSDGIHFGSTAAKEWGQSIANQIFSTSSTGGIVAPPKLTNSKILHVGDSHSTGPYGIELNKLLRTVSTQVRHYGQCGAAPAHYLSTDELKKIGYRYTSHSGWTTNCGSYFVLEDGTTTRVKQPTPIFSKIMEEFKPSTVIITLGGNMFHLGSKTRQSTAKEMAEAATKNGAKCYWVGPKYGPTTTYEESGKVLDDIRIGVEGKCIMIDSRKIAEYKWCGDKTCCCETNTHFFSSNSKQKEAATNWAKGVFSQVRGLVSTAAVGKIVQTTMPYCQGGNLELLDQTAYKKCARFKDKFLAEGKRQGLFDLGFDPLALFAIAYGESSCNTADEMAAKKVNTANGGIFQVDSPCYYKKTCVTLDDEIREGVKEIKSKLVSLQAKGLQGKNLVWMLLYSYNRGMGAAYKAIDHMNKGKTIQQGCDEACGYYYGYKDGRCSTRDCFTGMRDKSCKDGKICDYNYYCSHDDKIGIHYVDKRWPLYEQSCQKIGGKVVVGGSITLPGTTTVGGDVPTEYRPAHPYFTVPYSVNPGFNVKTDYDFKIYEKIGENVKTLDKCKDSIGCVVKKLPEFEKSTGMDWVLKYGGNVVSKDTKGNSELNKWELFCEPSSDNAINSITEAIDICTSISQEGCSCAYEIPVTGKEKKDIEDSVFIKKLLVSVIPLFGPIMSLFIEPEWKERTIKLTNTATGIDISMNFEKKIIKQSVSNVKLNAIGKDIAVDKTSLKYSSNDFGKKLYIYRDKKTKEEKSKSEKKISIYSEQGTPTKEECVIFTKTAKFCVIQDKTYLAYDPYNKKYGVQQSVIKFGYLFKPKIMNVKNFEIYDQRKSEGSLIFAWDSFKDLEVAKFKIYNSSLPAAKTMLVKKPEDLEKDNNFKKTLTVTEILAPQPYEVKNIDRAALIKSPTCTLFNNVCTYSDQLQKSNLYFDKDNGLYFYIVEGFENDKTQYIGITAVDEDGKESPTIVLPKEGKQEKARDDLEPALPQFTAIYDGTTKKVKISITPTTKNIDGSEMKDAVKELKTNNIYCFNPNDMDLTTNSFDFALKRSVSSVSALKFNVEKDASDITGECGDTPYLFVTITDIKGNEFSEIVPKTSLVAVNVPKVSSTG